MASQGHNELTHNDGALCRPFVKIFYFPPIRVAHVTKPFRIDASWSCFLPDLISETSWLPINLTKHSICTDWLWFERSHCSRLPEREDGSCSRPRISDVYQELRSVYQELRLASFDDVLEYWWLWKLSTDTLRPDQNGWHSADDILKCIFLKEDLFKIIPRP